MHKAFSELHILNSNNEDREIERERHTHTSSTIHCYNNHGEFCMMNISMSTHTQKYILHP